MSGRKWTRFTLVLMLFISAAANIGHTILATSTIPIWLRMIGAVVWPLIVFLAIEVLVRTVWGKGVAQGLIRAMILVPAIPAAITSYEHMHAVLLAMGERPFIAKIGPGAVDLLMIGCTLALLLAYRKPAPSADQALLPVDEVLLSVEEALERWSVSEDAPISPAPSRESLESADRIMVAPSPQNVETLEQVERVSTRAPRSSWDASRVVDLALEGVSAPEASAETGIGLSSYRRFLRVAKILQSDPRATIEKTEKVPAVYVGMMRERLLTR